MKRFYVLSSVFLALLLMSAASNALADNQKEKLRDQLPDLLLNQDNNNLGTEFYLSFPTCYEINGNQNSIRIYVSSGVETDVTVEVEGKAWVRKAKTIANDIIEFNLPGSIAQPYSRQPGDAVPAEKVYPQYGVKVYADDPIIVYGVTRFRYTSDGFLGVPVSALGFEYIVNSFADGVSLHVWGEQGQLYPSETTITAAFPNTKVTVIYGGNQTLKTGGGVTPGETRQYNLGNAGDVLAISSASRGGDLSGTKIISDKPVAVVSGNYCTFVPVDVLYCDYTVEMEFPTETWGTEYHVAPFPLRKKNAFMKVVAKEPNTTVYRNGQPIALLRTAGGFEDIGYLNRRVADGDPAPYVISGDKPIMVSLWNAGNNDDDRVTSTDPCQIILTPLQQYQKEIVFNTPGVRGGLGYPSNFVSLVYAADENGFIPDDLEFAQVSGGQFTWTRIKDRFGAFPGQPYFGEIEGVKYNLKVLELPGDGVYKIRGNKGFAAYAYGHSQDDSFCFAASVALGDLTKPDTVAPEVEYEVDCDGSVKGAIVRDLPNDRDIRSNLSKLFMDRQRSFNYTFEYDEDNFIPGRTIQTEWSLKVIDPLMDAQATLVFVDRAGNATEIVVNYAAFNATLGPDRRNLGIFAVGQTKNDQTVTITNTSDLDPVTITRFEWKGNVPGFKVLEMDLSPVVLPITLAPKETRDYRVQYTADVDGDFCDVLGIGNDCQITYITEVCAGTGEAIIAVSDAMWDPEVINAPKIAKEIRIVNKGTIPLIIDGWTPPADAAFEVEAKLINAMNAGGITLGPVVGDNTEGESYTFKVNFTPREERTYPDQIVFQSNATTIDNIAVLYGEGLNIAPSVVGEDFGTRRINDDKYGTTGLQYQGDVQIGNDGSYQVEITGYKFGAAAGSDASQFTFLGNTLDQAPPNNVYFTVDPAVNGVTTNWFGLVQFRPTTLGSHHVWIDFEYFDHENQQNATLRADIFAEVIVPRMNTADLAFPIMNIGDPAQTDKVRFTVEDFNEGEQVTLTGFVFTNEADGDFTINGYKLSDGSAVAADANQKFTTPVVIAKGDYIEVDVAFSAKQSGIRNATLAAESDAIVDPVSNWTGEGELQGITTAPNGIRDICVGNTGSFDVTISNTGTGTIMINDVTLQTPGAEFTLVDVRDGNGTVLSGFAPFTPFQLGAGETVFVGVDFTPAGSGTFNNTIEIANNTNSEPVITADIFGESISYISGSRLAFVGNPVPTEFYPGDDFVLQASITDGIVANAGVQKIILTYEYNGLVIGPQRVNGRDFTIDVNTAEYTLDPNNKPYLNNIGTKSEQLVVTLLVTDDLPANEWVANVVYEVFLASDQEIDVNLSIATEGSACAVVTEDNETSRVSILCAPGLRNILVDGPAYAISTPTPNPIVNSATINYSVGIEAQTSIVVHNSMGEVVMTLVDDVVKPGNYELTISIDDLASGVYYYTFNSGPYTATKEMVITR